MYYIQYYKERDCGAITKKYLTVDGVKLAYEEYGHGKPVLFLHGFGASSFSWRFVAQTLSKQLNRRCICLDLMGFGASEKPLDESYTLTRQANLVSGFISKMEIESLSLVGHSYGGGVCLTLVSCYVSILDHKCIVILMNNRG